VKRKPEKHSMIRSFFRTQLASGIATGADFFIFLLTFNFFGLWYLYATPLGALTGAGVHFLLGRYWSFLASRGQFIPQAGRYFLVASASLALNTYGMYLMVGHYGFPTWGSKITVVFLVSIFFNFPLHRYFVFFIPHRRPTLASRFSEELVEQEGNDQSVSRP
jgi:putative flippase GtrA